MNHRSAIRMYAFACVATGFAWLAAPAHAQYKPRPLDDPATGEKYHIEAAAALWFPAAELAVSSESLGIQGTSIDLKKDLGLQDQRLASLRLVLRPTKHSKFRLEFIPIKYDSSATLQRDIIFNGIRYPKGLPVNSTFDWKAYRFAYEYDVASGNRWFVGFVLEAKYTDVQVQLASSIANEFASARAPIPALGGIARVYVVPNISITGEFTGFKLPENLIKDTAAHYVDFDLYGTLNFTNYVGVQVGYRSLDLGISVKSTGASVSSCPALPTTGTNGCFTLKGPYLGIVARY